MMGLGPGKTCSNRAVTKRLELRVHERLPFLELARHAGSISPLRLESRTVTEGSPGMSARKPRTLLRAWALVGALLPCLGAIAHAAPEAADLLLVNGRVYTLAWDEPDRDGTPAANAPRSPAGWRPDAEAVAVRGDRIVFVGRTREAQAYRGPKTRVVDLAGATVLPGLVDSHTHVAELGEMTTKVDLTDVKTEEEAVARVAARAASGPQGPVDPGPGLGRGGLGQPLSDREAPEREGPRPPRLPRAASTASRAGATASPSHARASPATPRRPRAARS